MANLKYHYDSSQYVPEEKSFSTHRHMIIVNYFTSDHPILVKTRTHVTTLQPQVFTWLEGCDYRLSDRGGCLYLRFATKEDAMKFKLVWA